jgi:hypothetical protein
MVRWGSPRRASHPSRISRNVSHPRSHAKHRSSPPSGIASAVAVRPRTLSSLDVATTSSLEVRAAFGITNESSETTPSEAETAVDRSAPFQRFIRPRTLLALDVATAGWFAIRADAMNNHEYHEQPRISRTTTNITNEHESKTNR